MKSGRSGRFGSRYAFYFGVIALMTFALFGHAQSTENLLVVRSVSFNLVDVGEVEDVEVNATNDVEDGGQVLSTTAHIRIEGIEDVCNRGPNPLLFDHSTAAEKILEYNTCLQEENLLPKCELRQ